MAEPAGGELPFPSSLCHRCGAPPRYVRGARSVFILCPRLPGKYPPQPVLRCPLFTPAEATPAPPRSAKPPGQGLP